MDGYAVRSQDQWSAPLIGSAPAGHPFAGTVGPDEAVRLFTGSVVPEGADAVLAQEDADADGDNVRFRETPHPGQIHPAARSGFRGAALCWREAGRRLSARDLALLAAGDVADVEVRRRPGDRLRRHRR